MQTTRTPPSSQFCQSPLEACALPFQLQIVIHSKLKVEMIRFISIIATALSSFQLDMDSNHILEKKMEQNDRWRPKYTAARTTDRQPLHLRSCLKETAGAAALPSTRRVML